MNDQEKIRQLLEALDVSQANHNRLLKDYMRQKELISHYEDYFQKKKIILNIDSYTDRENVIVALANAGFTVSSHKVEKNWTTKYYVDIIKFPEEIKEDS